MLQGPWWWPRVTLSMCLVTEVAVVAKSNIVLDVKPWDDETDMKEMERCVRTVACDGLLWGACKYLPHLMTA